MSNKRSAVDEDPFQGDGDGKKPLLNADKSKRKTKADDFEIEEEGKLHHKKGEEEEMGESYKMVSANLQSRFTYCNTQQ